jgi:hypothetical protein
MLIVRKVADAEFQDHCQNQVRPPDPSPGALPPIVARCNSDAPGSARPARCEPCATSVQHVFVIPLGFSLVTDSSDDSSTRRSLVGVGFIQPQAATGEDGKALSKLPDRLTVRVLRASRRPSAVGSFVPGIPRSTIRGIEGKVFLGFAWHLPRKKRCRSFDEGMRNHRSRSATSFCISRLCSQQPLVQPKSCAPTRSRLCVRRLHSWRHHRSQCPSRASPSASMEKGPVGVRELQETARQIDGTLGCSWHASGVCKQGAVGADSAPSSPAVLYSGGNRVALFVDGLPDRCHVTLAWHYGTDSPRSLHCLWLPIQRSSERVRASRVRQSGLADHRARERGEMTKVVTMHSRSYTRSRCHHATRGRPVHVHPAIPPSRLSPLSLLQRCGPP